MFEKWIKSEVNSEARLNSVKFIIKYLLLAAFDIGTMLISENILECFPQIPHLKIILLGEN